MGPNPGRGTSGQLRKLHVIEFSAEHGGFVLTARRGSKTGGYLLEVDDDLLEQVEQARGEEDAPVMATARPAIESGLTPREIQTRLRAGRSVEDVASEAGVSVDWVDRFSAPVYAEQAAAVERAGRAVMQTLRKGRSDRSLEASVLRNLADRGLLVVEEEFRSGWSARHMVGVEWLVSFSFRNRGRSMYAEWLLDVSTGTVTPRNRLGTELGFVDAGRHLAAVIPLEAGTEPDEAPPTRRRRRGRPRVRKAVAKKAPARKVAAKAGAAKQSAAAKKAASVKKAAAKKAAARKAAAAKKAAAKKALAVKKAAGKKTAVTRASAKKVAARNVGTPRVTARKATAAKKSTTTKRAANKVAARKVGARKSVAKKLVAKKAVAKRVVAKKATTARVAAKAAPAKKAAGRKAAGRKAVAAKPAAKRARTTGTAQKSAPRSARATTRRAATAGRTAEPVGRHFARAEAAKAARPRNLPRVPSASHVVVGTPTMPTPVVIVPEPPRASPVTNGQAPPLRADRTMRADRPLRANRVGLAMPESARLRAPIDGETGEFPALPRSLRD